MGIPQDGGCKALGDSHQTGPIHLHNLIVHFDPVLERQREEMDEEIQHECTGPEAYMNIHVTLHRTHQVTCSRKDPSILHRSTRAKSLLYQVCILTTANEIQSF